MVRVTISRLRRTAIVSVVVPTFGFMLGACSDDRAELGATESTVASTGAFDPPLPAGINVLPYTYGATVGLGTWKIRVTDTDTTVAGEVALELWVQNGSLDEQTLLAESFLYYDDRNRGSAPEVDGDALTPELASGEVVDVSLVFAAEAGTEPRALLFRGTSVYGGRALDGLMSLDPEFDGVLPD
jgi:hypothetical protein